MAPSTRRWRAHWAGRRPPWACPWCRGGTLAWDRPTDDLDLHLWRWVDMRCDEVSHDGVNGGPELATRQVLHQDGLPAGYYRLWIVPQHGVAIDYTLVAVFRQ